MFYLIVDTLNFCIGEDLLSDSGQIGKGAIRCVIMFTVPYAGAYSYG